MTMAMLEWHKPMLIHKNTDRLTRRMRQVVYPADMTIGEQCRQWLEAMGSCLVKRLRPADCVDYELFTRPIYHIDTDQTVCMTFSTSQTVLKNAGMSTLPGGHMLLYIGRDRAGKRVYESAHTIVCWARHGLPSGYNKRLDQHAVAGSTSTSTRRSTSSNGTWGRAKAGKVSWHVVSHTGSGCKGVSKWCVHPDHLAWGSRQTARMYRKLARKRGFGGTRKTDSRQAPSKYNKRAAASDAGAAPSQPSPGMQTRQH